jgi:hypothetical protein
MFAFCVKFWCGMTNSVYKCFNLSITFPETRKCVTVCYHDWHSRWGKKLQNMSLQANWRCHCRQTEYVTAGKLNMSLQANWICHCRQTEYVTSGKQNMSLQANRICHFWQTEYVTAGKQNMSLQANRICHCRQTEYVTAGKLKSHCRIPVRETFHDVLNIIALVLNVYHCLSHFV